MEKQQYRQQKIADIRSAKGNQRARTFDWEFYYRNKSISELKDAQSLMQLQLFYSAKNKRDKQELKNNQIYTLQFLQTTGNVVIDDILQRCDRQTYFVPGELFCKAIHPMQLKRYVHKDKQSTVYMASMCHKYKYEARFNEREHRGACVPHCLDGGTTVYVTAPSVNILNKLSLNQPLLNDKKLHRFKMYQDPESCPCHKHHYDQYVEHARDECRRMQRMNHKDNKTMYVAPRITTHDNTFCPCIHNTSSRIKAIDDTMQAFANDRDIILIIIDYMVFWESLDSVTFYSTSNGTTCNLFKLI